MRYIVALYEIDRGYGGPEEGGWCYDCGTLKRSLRVCTSETTAAALALRANRLLARLQRQLRDVGSILYEGGRFAAYVCETTAPEHFPAARPRFE